jgi:hypothetical protein
MTYSPETITLDEAKDICQRLQQEYDDLRKKLSRPTGAFGAYVVNDLTDALRLIKMYIREIDMVKAALDRTPIKKEICDLANDHFNPADAPRVALAVELRALANRERNRVMHNGVWQNERADTLDLIATAVERAAKAGAH